MKKISIIALALALCLGMAACGKLDTQTPPASGATVPSSQAAAGDAGELVILYTNDVHNAYQREDTLGQMGYAAVAEYRDRLESAGKTVILVDGGDAIQGEAVGDLSEGAYLVDIMNEVGYEIGVPGCLDFDFGVDIFLELAKNRAAYDYLACNFLDLRTGETVFDAYKIVNYGGVKIAYVGICSPETLTNSGFREGNGSSHYSFAQGNGGQELYDCVQQAIDDAKAAGADYVICVGHLGTDPNSTPWTSYEVISNTTGMIAFLDGNSHSVIEGETVADKDGNEVVLCSTGAKLTVIGEIRVDLNTGAVSAALVSGLTEDDREIRDFTDAIAAQVEELQKEADVAAETEIPTDAVE